MKPTNIIFLVVLTLLVGGVSIYFIFEKDEIDVDPDIVNVVDRPLYKSQNSASMSPNGKYIIYQKVGTEGNYHSLELRNLETDEREVLSTVSTSNEYHSFLWTSDSTRVYYAWTGTENTGNTTFFYYSPNDATPGGWNNISYEDDELILSGKVTISGVQDDILYVRKDDSIYSIDITEGPGAQPVHVLDL